MRLLPRRWTCGCAANSFLTLAMVSGSLCAAEPSTVLSGASDRLEEVLRGVLVAGGTQLLNGGVGPFQEKARNRARQFVVDQKLGERLETEDEAFVDKLAVEVFDDFRAKFRARDDAPDPALKGLAAFLRPILERLHRPVGGITVSPERFEQDALFLALEIYKLKTNNLGARPFEGASRQFVLDLAREILRSRDPAPPAPVNDGAAIAEPTAADTAGKLTFTDQVRADLINVLRRKDASALRAQKNNGETVTEDQRVEQLTLAIAAPRNSFLRALNRLPDYQTITSVTELSPADQKELTERMIPEAVRQNSATPANPTGSVSNGKTRTRVDLDNGSSVGGGRISSYDAPVAGTPAEDVYLLTEGTSLPRGCRLFGGTRRASRGAVLLPSPYRGRSSRPVVYYVE